MCVQVSHFHVSTTNRTQLDVVRHRKVHGHDNECVTIPCVTNIDPSSWRPLASEISREMTEFSHRFAASISHTSNEHTSQLFRSPRGIKQRLLMHFPCSSCTSSSFNNYTFVTNLSDRSRSSSADLHKALR